MLNPPSAFAQPLGNEPSSSRAYKMQLFLSKGNMPNHRTLIILLTTSALSFAWTCSSSREATAG